MTNQLSKAQAISQHKYNTLVLNGITLGVLTTILTAVFLPVGQGAFFGITFLCLILTTAMLLPINTAGPSSKISAGKIILAITIYGITCMFFYLSGMEIMHWNIPYNEYRQMFHKENGYVWLKTNYEEQKELLAILSLWIPLFISFAGSFFLGTAVFGWKLGVTKIPEGINVDFFLLNPVCAWFPWKRKIM